MRLLLLLVQVSPLLPCSEPVLSDQLLGLPVHEKALRAFVAVCILSQESLYLRSFSLLMWVLDLGAHFE